MVDFSAYSYAALSFLVIACLIGVVWQEIVSLKKKKIEKRKKEDKDWKRKYERHILHQKSLSSKYVFSALCYYGFFFCLCLIWQFFVAKDVFIENFIPGLGFGFLWGCFWGLFTAIFLYLILFVANFCIKRFCVFKNDEIRQKVLEQLDKKIWFFLDMIEIMLLFLVYLLGRGGSGGSRSGGGLRGGGGSFGGGGASGRW